jgi:hypothetical protein
LLFSPLKGPLSHYSVLSPLVGALHTFVKSGHGLVPSSDLHHIKVGPFAKAFPRRIGTLDLLRVDVYPRILPSEHIINFLLLQLNRLLQPRLDLVDVGTGPAKEAEVLVSGFDQQDVGAGGAEQHA